VPALASTSVTRRNKKLYEKVLERETILSEFRLFASRAREFPIRNRIVAGMPLGVIVIEGGVQRVLITARLAMEFGRGLASPGILHKPLATRPICWSASAKLVVNAEDVIEELPPQCARAGKAERPEAEQRNLLAFAALGAWKKALRITGS
jgi:DNA processing protein